MAQLIGAFQVKLYRNQLVVTAYLEAVSKNGFWFKVKADARFKPEEYIMYFEDLNRTPNAEIEPKDFFEMLLRI
jgi:hypothetical protein